MHNFIESLTPTQLERIAAVIERGLEFETVTYPATKDPEALARIADTCLFLTGLYVRKLDINRSGRNLPDCLG